MKNFLFLVLVICAIIAISCQDGVIESPSSTLSSITPSSTRNFGNSRMVFSSREELAEVIKAVKDDGSIESTRSIVVTPVSSDEEAFQSLYEANKETYLASLTASERAELDNDPDELEFALPDSIISDFQFSCILNKDREIQIGDTVFKFISSGIGYTPASNADNLRLLDSIVQASKKPELGNLGTPVALDKNIQFIYVTCVNIYDTDLGLGGGGGYNPSSGEYNDSYPPASENLSIPKTQITIPKEDVREIEFSKKNQHGDEGSVSGWIKGLFGFYASGFKYFSSRYKLNMNFYDQNYLIYSNIGTKLKLQKKVLGIWWNVKAQEMYHGWETICIAYEKPKVITSYFPSSATDGRFIKPNIAYAPTNYALGNDVLFHIPIVEYDITSKNLGSLFKSALTTARNRYLLSNDPYIPSADSGKDQGLFSYEDKKLYIMYGPSAVHSTKKRSMETKFFSKWFPTSFSISLMYQGGFKLKNINFDPNDHVELIHGVAYGAVKYNDRWLGVRLKKIHFK